MAEIKNFLYCLNVNTEEGRTDVVGVMSAMSPEYIPGLFSFSISFSILDISEGNHLLNIKFTDPDDNVVAGLDNVTISYKKDENSNLPDEEIGLNIAAGMQNVDFKKSGKYSTEVILDGTSIGKYYIYAKGKNE